MKRMLMVFIIFCMIPAAAFAAAETIKLRYTASLYVDERGGALSRPEGAGCSDRKIVVADTGNGQLLKYVYQQGMFKFEGQVKIPELISPAKVQLTSKGEILAFDQKNLRIVRISTEGAFAGFVQPAGLPAPEAWTARSFALDAQDNIYILDIAADRVLVLDPSGKYQREIKYPKEYGFFSDITVNAGGMVFALDSVGNRVYSGAASASVLSPFSDPLKEHLRFPASITTDSTGLLFITDKNSGAMLILNQGGSIQGKDLGRGWKEGLLRYPSQACVSGEGILFIADRDNNRVQAFTLIK